MNHLVLALEIFEWSFVGTTQSKDIDAWFRETDVVFILKKDQATDLRLPKLEWLVSKKSGPILKLTRKILNDHIVSIHKACLKRNNQLFVRLLTVLNLVEISIISSQNI